MLQGVRRGDADSIAQLVRVYEPFIRRTVRYRLSRVSLRAVADSVDVCQSVLGSLLIRLTAGQYELHSDEDLRKLLTSMAGHKFMSLQRRELSEKRDRRLTVSLDDTTEIVDARQTSPEWMFEFRSLLAAFERRLSDHEQEIYRKRQQGLTWNAIAEEMSEDAALLRKRMSRAIRRVALELGIVDDTDDDITIGPEPQRRVAPPCDCPVTEPPHLKFKFD